MPAISHGPPRAVPQPTAIAPGATNGPLDRSWWSAPCPMRHVRVACAADDAGVKRPGLLVMWRKTEGQQWVGGAGVVRCRAPLWPVGGRPGMLMALAEPPRCRSGEIQMNAVNVEDTATASSVNARIRSAVALKFNPRPPGEDPPRRVAFHVLADTPEPWGPSSPVARPPSGTKRPRGSPAQGFRARCLRES